MRKQVKNEIIAFVTGRKERPTLNQILGTVRSYVLKNILTKEEIMQILEEVEQGVKRGAIVPMSPGKEERFNEVKGAIENLLKTCEGC
ncbi:MAG: hypothetical protein J7K33_03470 [Candidatus Marinimicrobia bacterium]|nr:hypothetical protein [Candidatus Neomarinimicrobiota bacterium]